jgi:hypothetical protein
VRVRWLTTFLDNPPGIDVERFWSRITGTTLSPRRGAHDEFATLIPPSGDAFIRVQNVGDGLPRCHVDLHVDDVRVMVGHATSLDATVVTDHRDWSVLASPAGLLFCVVPHHGSGARPEPVPWPGGQHSVVDQVCLDIPAAVYDAETSFWTSLFGWRRQPGSLPEFEHLVRPPDMPLRLAFQKLDDAKPAERVGAHIDVACDDVVAEAARHIELGATLVRRRSWITLQDPSGREYCVTNRDPFMGTKS